MISYKEVAFGSDGYQQTLRVREEILRKPINMRLRPKDVEMDDHEFHIAAYDDGKMIGCVLLRPLENEHIKLRQMAVVDGYQGRGIGAGLVTFAEALAHSRGFKNIECNARITAEGFYAKLGYSVLSEPFLEVDLYTIKMGKAL